MTDQHLDISRAIVVFLWNYPGKNDEQFDSEFSTDAREQVRGLLDETSKITIDWGDKSLIEIGDDVERIMHERHPDLSAAALEKLSNYFTYLVR